MAISQAVKQVILHLGASLGLVPVLHLALWLGADPNDSKALEFAALGGHLIAFEFLIRNGAQVDEHLFEKVIKHPNPQRGILQALNRELGDPIRQKPVLSEAVKSGSLAAVKHLIGLGANVHAANPQHKYWTPLHYAAFSGDVRKVEILLSQHAHPRSQDAFGQTPMQVASGDERELVIQSLENESKCRRSPSPKLRRVGSFS